MRNIAIISIVLAVIMLAATGCANHAQNRAAQGAAIGALAGKAWGNGSDRDIITGTAIGAGIGYAIGNEEDKIANRGIVYQDDSYHRPAPHYAPSRYSGNAGVESAYHRGRSDYYKQQQREAERRARDQGRAGW